ncbi:MAG: ribokinase [Thalassobaculales bacterium]
MIIVFGSLNADLVFRVGRLPGPGETVLGPGYRFHPGGKGANQAVAAARAGAEVRFFGAAGRDGLGDAVLTAMAGAGVDVTGVLRVADTTGTAAIMVDDAGRNLIAVGSGANLAARADQVPDHLLRAGCTLVLQREVAEAQSRALALRARARGARVVWNLAPAEPGMALPPADVVVANEHEAELVAGPCAVEDQARALGPFGVVTLGAEGVVAAVDGEILRLPAPKVEVTDTTGAGDCFVGVLAAGLDQGLPAASALHRAVIAASLACTREGAQAAMPDAAAIAAAEQSAGALPVSRLQ